MKKQEFDSIENIYSNTRIPANEVNNALNSTWWKNVYHSSEKESQKEDIFIHDDF